MALSKDYSKTNFTIETPTWDSVKIGALQRIADATEAMAKNHIRLQEEVEWEKNLRKDLAAQLANAKLSITALRGVITKLRRREAGK